MEELQKAGGFLENAEFSGTNMKMRHPQCTNSPLTNLRVLWIMYVVVFLIGNMYGTTTAAVHDVLNAGKFLKSIMSS